EGSGSWDAGGGRAREAAYVELVDDRLRERPGQRPVALPVVGGRVDHRRAQRGGDVVARPDRRTAIPEGGGDAARIRVEQHLLPVERERAAARPIGTVRIGRTGSEAGDEHVPEVEVAR